VATNPLLRYSLLLGSFLFVAYMPPQGRLYGNVDTINSAWQLEPRTSRLSARERTTSTISTTSTQSSYAFISDPEISSSFAASVESGHGSDTDELVMQSPALSSPISTASDERPNPASFRRSTVTPSRPVSPGHPLHSVTSSISSVDSLHSSHSGRLLTIHLEKEQSIIWPSLIVGPVDVSVSPCAPNPFLCELSQEQKYNMDPTSLVLTALELFDIRRDKDEAFEYFVYVCALSCHDHLLITTLQASLASGTRAIRDHETYNTLSFITNHT
jgi:hypothetical protein